MSTINTRENRQVIDYMARDYGSIRQALMDLIPAKIPEWTDRSEADFGIAMIELFAYMADILSYYQDRMANEAFLNTAQERRSIINHLRLIGYEMAPAAPATARLSLILGDSATQAVEIRKGDQFSTPSARERKSIMFEYTGEKPLVIDPQKEQFIQDPPDPKTKDGAPMANYREFAGVIPVREGRTIGNETIGVSDGTANQRFKLSQPQLLRDSLEIKVETTPPTPPWRLRKNPVFGRRAFTEEELDALERQERIGSTLAFSREADRDYYIETDENDVTTVVFGDGQYGKIPEKGMRIIANYRVGGGSAGNVGAGQITVISKSPQLQLVGAKVVNRMPASGGAERESIEHAIKFAPIAFTSMQRAVSSEDYASLARLFPGVSKARVEATNWNTVNLYIAPTGGGEPPSDILKQELLAYFEDKRMVTSIIRIGSPAYPALRIEAEIGVSPYFRREDVQNKAERAVTGLFDFEKMDFKQTVYLSKIYEALEAIDGIDNVYVKKFYRVDGTGGTGIASDGRIETGENEIAVLRGGDLVITVKDAGD